VIKRVGVIIFGSIRFLSKKVTKLKFKKKPNRNQVKPTDFVSVWFFREKTDSNRFGSVLALFFWFGSVFPVWLGFSSLARFGSVFSGLARFFPGFFVWVRFGFFSFLLIKPNRLVFLKF